MFARAVMLGFFFVVSSAHGAEPVPSTDRSSAAINPRTEELLKRTTGAPAARPSPPVPPPAPVYQYMEQAAQAGISPFGGSAAPTSAEQPKGERTTGPLLPGMAAGLALALAYWGYRRWVRR